MSPIKVLRGKSFNIDGWVRVYNLFMVAVSFYLCREFWVNTMGYYYWPCEPLDHSTNQGHNSMANLFHLVVIVTASEPIYAIYQEG